MLNTLYTLLYLVFKAYPRYFLLYLHIHCYNWYYIASPAFFVPLRLRGSTHRRKYTINLGYSFGTMRSAPSGKQFEEEPIVPGDRVIDNY